MAGEEAPSQEDSPISESEAALLEALQIAHERQVTAVQRGLAPLPEAIADAIAESNAELLESQIAVNQAVLSDVSAELAENQWMLNQAIQSAVSEDLQRLNAVLSAAIADLNVPSIEAGLQDISQSHHDQDNSPYYAIDDDALAEPSLGAEAERKRRSWYRKRSVETAVTVVDYLFWKAKQGGEMTDASDEEVAVTLFIAVLCLTSVLNGGPSLTSAAGAATGVDLAQKAGRKRSDRRNLDEKFQG